MKTLKLFSAVCVAILLVAPVFVQAQDFRSPYGAARTNAGPSRSFLGLPIPQQWSGIRPAAASRYSGNGVYRGSNYNNSSAGQFSNARTSSGQCATGNCRNGRYADGNGMTGSCAAGTCRDCSCPNGACASGLCASGRCPACANGQCVGCASGQCGIGQSVNGNCPGGRCPLNQYSNSRYNSTPDFRAQDDWSPRASRSNTADPFRGAAYQGENNNWTQRPALRNPVSELYPSRYNQSDLDLRSPYFNNQSGELNKSRSGDRSSAANETRAPRPSDRSMFDAPAERADGFTQI